MAASAVVLIIVILCIILIFHTPSYNKERGINKSLFLLCGCLGGIIFAAITVSLLIYFYNRHKDAALRKQGCKIQSPITDTPSPMIGNCSNAKKGEACSVAVQPPPASTMGYRKQQMDTETNHYTEMDIHHHAKRTRHNSRLNVLPSTNLNTIQENPISETFNSNNRLDNVVFELDQGTRSLLESSC